jgi:transposase
MRPKGSAAQLEERRRQAIAMLGEGKTPTKVAKVLKTTPTSVCRWQKAHREGGARALKAVPHPGPEPKLTKSELKKLRRMVLQGPKRHGYATELWTLARVAELIEVTFGVTYDPSQVWRILRGLGFSCQKPERRARQRDEQAIAQWRLKEWPRIKKRAAKRGEASSLSTKRD